MIDYYIICTEQPDDVIVRVGINDDLTKRPASSAKTRQEVINDLDNCKTIYTAHTWIEEDGYKLGAKVKKVCIGGKHFITTKANNTTRDNLDEIRKCNF